MRVPCIEICLQRPTTTFLKNSLIKEEWLILNTTLLASTSTTTERSFGFFWFLIYQIGLEKTNLV